jgi:hypothetical protein
MATFFAIFIYILIFFITLKYKNKWENGHKARNPNVHGVFRWPLLFLKMAKWPKKMAKIQIFHQTLSKKPTKNGHNPLLQTQKWPQISLKIKRKDAVFQTSNL